MSGGGEGVVSSCTTVRMREKRTKKEGWAGSEMGRQFKKKEGMDRRAGYGFNWHLSKRDR